MSKILSSVLASSVLVSSLLVAPIATHAAQATEKANESVTINAESLNQLRKEASKYISIDSNEKIFVIDNEAKRHLTKKEFDLVKQMVDISNEQLSQAKEQLVATDRNSFKLSSATGSGVSVQSINPSAWTDYEFYWWGVHFYYSHQAIETYKNNNCLAYVGAAITALPIAGWMRGLMAAAAVTRSNDIINNDYGNGVYADIFYPVSPILTAVSVNVYPA